jgi:hypothetical protein
MEKAGMIVSSCASVHSMSALKRNYEQLFEFNFFAVEDVWR